MLTNRREVNREVLDEDQRPQPARGNRHHDRDRRRQAEVTVDIGNGNEVVAAITRHSVASLGLKIGSPVVAIIKSTEVSIGAE
jgi:molybdopterin-binding protein